MTDPQTSSLTSASAPRRPVLRFLRKRLRSWLDRHRHPFNLGIHLIGIPLAVAGLVLLFTSLPWYWGVGGIVLGYLLLADVIKGVVFVDGVKQEYAA
jgi:uncharacterized membrane protein YGL010W